MFLVFWVLEFVALSSGVFQAQEAADGYPFAGASF
jgi:hypothetical protein